LVEGFVQYYLQTVGRKISQDLITAEKAEYNLHPVQVHIVQVDSCDETTERQMWLVTHPLLM
jgi:hypothetical protein